jgi:hypothetical protein
VTTPALDTLTPRDYRVPQADIAANVKAFIEQSADAFECLLYRANNDEPEAVTTEEDTVGSIESTERTVTYQLPVLCRAVIVPDGSTHEVDIEGDVTSPGMADPVVMILTEVDIPDQSVIQYREYIGAVEVRDVTLYVLKSGWVGDAPGVCPKHYCLPMQRFEDLKP